MQRLVNLPETPDAVRIDAFYRFLEQFVQNKELGIKQILELLPLSAATEREWEARRGSISLKLISEVDAFVNAMSNEPRDNRTLWREYADTLGDKAGWYLQLAHPEIIPASMRSGFVLPEDEATINDLLDWWCQPHYDYYNEWLSETLRTLEKQGEITNDAQSTDEALE